MSYNWIKTDNPQGRERLKQLVDSGETIFVKVTGNHGIFYNVLAKIPNPLGRPREYTFLRQLLCYKRPFDWFVEIGIEFLDPEPPKPQPDENGLQEPEKPIGDFILCNATGIRLQDGFYYHYKDVCTLLNKWSRMEGGGK